MLGAHRVAAARYRRVRPPPFPCFSLDLLLYRGQGFARDAAELRGLVLYAEQDEVAVYDLCSWPPKRRLRLLGRMRSTCPTVAADLSRARDVAFGATALNRIAATGTP